MSRASLHLLLLKTSSTSAPIPQLNFDSVGVLEVQRHSPTLTEDFVDQFHDFYDEEYHLKTNNANQEVDLLYHEEDILEFESEITQHARELVCELRKARRRVRLMEQELNSQSRRHEEELAEMRHVHKLRMQETIKCFMDDLGRDAGSAALRDG